MTSQTLPLWLTDSSLVEWADTVKLDVCFPRWRWPEIVAESLGAEIDEHYEGLVDAAVPVGGAHVAWRQGGMDGQAEWAALFDQPLAALEKVDADTPCILQGMIQGQWIGPLADAKDVNWADSTIGNNLLARGRGIRTTLGGIAHAADGIGAATAMVNFPMACGGNRVHHAHGADLAKIPVVELARAVWRHAREHPGTPVRGISFGATGEMSAYAADPGRRRHHMRHAFLPRFFRKLMELCPRELFHVINEVRAAMYAEILERGEYARADATVILTVTDGRGWLVGEGAMLLQEGRMKAEG